MKIRSFIAIKLSQKIFVALENTIHDLKEAGVQNVRWTSPEAIHITLKFLGNIDTRQVDPISRRMKDIADHFSPFDIDIAGLGAFPKKDNPRTLWIGIKASDSLTQLQRNIESELGKMGFEKEERGFTPHLTLGRVWKNTEYSDVRTIAEKIKNHQLIDIGRMSVNEFHLYRSNLLPEGSQYTILASFAFIG